MLISEKKVSIPWASDKRSVWLRMGIVLDGLSAEPLKDIHVLYDANSIRYVGSAENLPPAELLNPGQTQPDAELGEYTLLPGLIEAHAHLFLEGGELNFEKRNAYPSPCLPSGSVGGRGL